MSDIRFPFGGNFGYRASACGSSVRTQGNGLMDATRIRLGRCLIRDPSHRYLAATVSVR